MVALGIDYGEARIGVAVTRGTLADPVAVIENDADVIAKIKKLSEEYGAEKIVMGVSEGKMAQKSRDFGQKLQDWGLKIEFQDETLTSHEAQEKLRHKRLKFRQQPQDAYQAAVMLQGWLDSR